MGHHTMRGAFISHQRFNSIAAKKRRHKNKSIK